MTVILSCRCGRTDIFHDEDQAREEHWSWEGEGDYLINVACPLCRVNKDIRDRIDQLVEEAANLVWIAPRDKDKSDMRYWLATEHHMIFSVTPEEVAQKWYKYDIDIECISREDLRSGLDHLARIGKTKEWLRIVRADIVEDLKWYCPQGWAERMQPAFDEIDHLERSVA